MVGLVTIAHFVRVVTTRVSLTEDGLRVGRRPTIPLDAITGFSVSSRGRDDVVNIEYVVEGKSCTVRLDSYVVKETPAIVAAIRERKGFAPASGTDSPSDRNAGSTGESD